MTDSRLRALMEKSPETWQHTLFEEYCAYVYAIAAAKLRSCGTPEDVEECVADAFLGIFAALKNDTGYEGELKGIIGTITRRTAIDAFRRISIRNSKNVSIDSEDAPVLADELCVAENAERNELREIVLSCINRLSRKYAEVLIHYYYYGRTLPQIARYFGISESAVQKRIQRARAKLKKLLEEQGISGEW